MGCAVPSGKGLLSKALRPGGLVAARKLSLANLLDHSVAANPGAEDRDGGAARQRSSTPFENSKLTLPPLEENSFSAASSQVSVDSSFPCSTQ